MVPEFVEKTGGSKWVQAQPAGSKWVSALPTGLSNVIPDVPPYSVTPSLKMARSR